MSDMSYPENNPLLVSTEPIVMTMVVVVVAQVVKGLGC